MSETAAEVLRKASYTRMKHAIKEAQTLIVLLDRIKNGNAPIQEMANVRGTVSKLCQSVHEASAYFSSYETVMAGKELLPMSRPHRRKKIGRVFIRDRRPEPSNESTVEETK
jgi:hypothetical protein